MTVTTTKLTARESRLLSTINSMRRAWIDRKQAANNRAGEYSAIEQAIADLEELRAGIIDGEDHRDPEFVNGVDCDARIYGR